MDDSREIRDAFSAGTFAILLAMLIPSVAYPIAMIVIGSININNCSLEANIPRWLITTGAVSIFLVVVLDIIILALVRAGFEIFTDIYHNVKDMWRTYFALYVIIVIVIIFTIFSSLFLFAWFIAGNVWVYSNYSKWQYTNASATGYCDRTLYLFSFWSIIAWYGLIIVFFAVTLCLSCFTAVCGVCGLGIGKTARRGKDIITARV